MTTILLPFATPATNRYTLRGTGGSFDFWQNETTFGAQTSLGKAAEMVKQCIEAVASVEAEPGKAWRINALVGDGTFTDYTVSGSGSGGVTLALTMTISGAAMWNMCKEILRLAIANGQEDARVLFGVLQANGA